MTGVIDAAWNFLRNRKRSYLHTFRTPAGEEVLRDLLKFCRANETTFHPDARVSAGLEGRREVWLRIQNHLNLSSEELYALAQGRTVHIQGDSK